MRTTLRSLAEGSGCVGNLDLDFRESHRVNVKYQRKIVLFINLMFASHKKGMMIFCLLAVLTVISYYIKYFVHNVNS